MFHEIFEQAEFARLQVDLGGAALYAMRETIQFEVADLVGRLLAAAPAATRRVHGLVLGTVAIALGVTSGLVAHAVGRQLWMAALLTASAVAVGALQQTLP